MVTLDLQIPQCHLQRLLTFNVAKFEVHSKHAKGRLKMSELNNSTTVSDISAELRTGTSMLLQLAETIIYTLLPPSSGELLTSGVKLARLRLQPT